MTETKNAGNVQAAIGVLRIMNDLVTEIEAIKKELILLTDRIKLLEIDLDRRNKNDGA